MTTLTTAVYLLGNTVYVLDRDDPNLGVECRYCHQPFDPDDMQVVRHENISSIFARTSGSMDIRVDCRPEYQLAAVNALAHGEVFEIGDNCQQCPPNASADRTLDHEFDYSQLPQARQRSLFTEWLMQFAGHRVVWQTTSADRPMWVSREVIEIGDPWTWEVTDSAAERHHPSIYIGRQACTYGDAFFVRSNGLDEAGFCNFSALTVADTFDSPVEVPLDAEFEFFKIFLEDRGISVS